MIDFSIWQDPETGEPLSFNRARRGFENPRTSRLYPADSRGILHFCGAEDAVGSDAASTRFYDRFAPFYEGGQKLYYSLYGGERKARNDYLQYLHIRPGDRVLEVSVGTGANIRCLPPEADYYGIDLSAGQLEQCFLQKQRRRLPLHLCQANAEALPFRDESFDAVFHVGGINLFSDREAAIREMVRVARPGAPLLIADETERVARRYQRLPFFGTPFRGREEIVPPVDLLPPNVTDVALADVRRGSLYCLTFCKAL